MLCGSGDPRDSSLSPLREVYRCPGGRRCSAYGSRCRVAPGRLHVGILPVTISARKGGPRFPCPDTGRDESWTRQRTLSASIPVQRSSESSSESTLRSRESRVSPQERPGSYATSDEGMI